MSDLDEKALLRLKAAYYMRGRDQAAEFVRNAGHPELATSIGLNWAGPGWLPSLCDRCGGKGDVEETVYTDSGADYANGPNDHEAAANCPACDGTGYQPNSSKLTDKQIDRIALATFARVQEMPDNVVNGSTWDREFARAIEAELGVAISVGGQNNV